MICFVCTFIIKSMITENPVPQANKQQRFKHVDSLRGIAALLVIWLHVSESFIKLPNNKSTLIYDMSWYINTGRVGVVIFFAISGFVLLNSIIGMKSFLIKRFLRLYPAFWLSIICGIFVLQDQFPSPSTLLANITMVPLMFDKGVIIGVYWTLESELIFYFIGLILFLFGVSRNPFMVFLMSMAFVLIFIVLLLTKFTAPNHTGLNVMPYHLAIMFWGGLYRHFYNQPKALVRVFKYSLSVKFILIILTIMVFAIPLASLIKGALLSEFKSIQFGLANLIGLTMFIVLTGYFKIKNGFMVWLGTISYSMYLFHPIIFSAVLWWFNNFALSTLNQMNLVTYLILNLFLTIVFSSIVYILIEKPSMNLASKIIYKKINSY